MIPVIQTWGHHYLDKYNLRQQIHRFAGTNALIRVARKFSEKDKHAHTALFGAFGLLAIGLFYFGLRYAAVERWSPLSILECF